MTTNTIVTIEDKNLAALLAYEICGNPNNLDCLTEENLATVTEVFSVTMVIPHKEELKVQSLQGLEYCTNLKQIHLIDHNIEDLSPLEHLSNLEVVVLRKNRLVSIDALAGKENIRVLVVGQNQLKDVSAASTMKGLTQLFVQENPLENDSLLFLNELPALREVCLWETNESILKEVGEYRSNLQLHYDKNAA